MNYHLVQVWARNRKLGEPVLGFVAIEMHKDAPRFVWYGKGHTPVDAQDLPNYYPINNDKEPDGNRD